VPQVQEAALPSLDEGLHNAELLHRAGKLHEALEQLHQLRLAYPGSADPLSRATALMLHLGQLVEVEPLIESGKRRFPETGALFVHHAVAAERRRDWAVAAARWAEVRHRLPDALEGYLGGGAALRELGRYTDADNVLREGMALLPDQLFLFVDFAHVAERQGDRPSAAQRWADAKSRFPAAWLCHVGLAAALRHNQQAGEAETVISAAAALWPEQLEVLIEHARVAEARKDWLESARRWEAIRTRDPENWPAYVEGAMDLLHAGRDEEAGALLTHAVERFPNETTPAIRLARWHDSRGEWDKSVPLWLSLQRNAPTLLESHLGAAAALRMAGRLDEAQQALDDARRRSPNERNVIREQVQLAYARENWTEAAAACAEGTRLFPEDGWFPRFGFEINVRLVDAAAAGDMIAAAAAADASAELSDRDRVMKFESLGGTGHGCEFGIYQRSHGAEPLGLLRWNDLNQDQLIEALESEFEGVGTPDQTVIFIPETRLRPQYWSRDKRFYMVSSTHVFVDEVTEEKLFPQLCRRLQFLRSKIIADLRAGEKIFVYKNMFRNLTEAELERLYRAMRHYGDNTLLYLCYVDAEHPDGTVEWRRRGLMLGYVARFTHAPDDAFLGPPDEIFDRVTRAAYQLWKSGTMPVE